jgi:hypothetical protein
MWGVCMLARVASTQRLSGRALPGREAGVWGDAEGGLERCDEDRGARAAGRSPHLKGTL